MVYVERNPEGKIVAIRQHADRPGLEPRSSVDAEVLAFLGCDTTEELIHVLKATDCDLIRILEDLIDLLVRKNIIIYTELPIEAQQKLQIRRQVRQSIAKTSIIVDDII
jgi:hypothetical protein